MSRGKDWTRHHRKRICLKRFHIQYDFWRRGRDLPGPHRQGRYIETREDVVKISKRLAKQNLACSCGMCTLGKRPNKRKDRHMAKLSLRKEVA